MEEEKQEEKQEEKNLTITRYQSSRESVGWLGNGRSISWTDRFTGAAGLAILSEIKGGDHGKSNV
jgi:hypothetical protein